MRKLLTMRLRKYIPFCLTAMAAVALMAPGAVIATPYVVKLVQQGNNVVASGSGAFDLTGLTFKGGYNLGSSGLSPALAYIQSGSTGRQAGYTGFTGPVSFGSGTYAYATRTGDTVGIFGSSSLFGVPILWVPSGYMSLGALSDFSTFDNASLASLGVTPGTYVWTWGAGADQSFTLEISKVANVPEPAALAMFGFGMLLVGAFVGLRRRMA